MSSSLVVIGGGAAGFFAAINAAAMNPELKVIILEKSQHLLAKVKVSGGGRCNVTHACFEPRELIKFYPRGSKELLGPFHTFQPTDMIEWLEYRGVNVKTEEDGRMFPSTDKSQTIIDCFLDEAKKYAVQIRTGAGVKSLVRDNTTWKILLSDGQELNAEKVLMATGSSNSMFTMIGALGHTLIESVPSLFTFNIQDKRIEGLAGVSSVQCEVRIEGTKFSATGPVLITHWGLSGPGILRLSAWAARELASVKYDFNIRVNWDTRFTKESCVEFLKEWKKEHLKSQVKAFSAVKIPHRLWCSLLNAHPAILETRWADISNKQIEQIAEAICSTFLRVNGKSTFKEEFVTAGGVSLKEVDFKTMKSKLLPDLYFAGEVLDIDAITGGFNFQAAWTTAFLAARDIAEA
jgi:predicted Rossmann fold flavoprotein